MKQHSDEKQSSLPHRPMMRLMWVTSLCLFVSGCVELGIPADGDKPHGELNPLQGMHDSPSAKDQEKQWSADGKEKGMRHPAPATVTRTERPVPAMSEPEKSARLENPVPVNNETLAYGELAYETSCVVCHGERGEGDGPVVGDNKFPKPPSLTTQRVRQWSDGRIYHVITHGQGRMWSYKSQLEPMERWAVINYIRVLQRAEYPEPWDGKKFE